MNQYIEGFSREAVRSSRFVVDLNRVMCARTAVCCGLDSLYSKIHSNRYIMVLNCCVLNQTLFFSSDR